MTACWQEELRPGEALRGIVQEATQALARMDADRLEELAHCCADLNREIRETGRVVETARDLDEKADVQVLGRILFETKANLNIFLRLRMMRFREMDVAVRDWKRVEGRTEYGDN
jgi:hypothetical protein